MTAYVVFWSTVHLFLVLSLTWGWTTCSIDFASAFVQAKKIWFGFMCHVVSVRLCLEKPASASEEFVRPPNRSSLVVATFAEGPSQVGVRIQCC